MDLIELREFCLSLPFSSEDMPFDETTVCFRVNNKIFALTGTDNVPPSVNLKCDPDLAAELRAEYSSIRPGYHMNKQHWNTVVIDDSIKDDFLKKLIAHSYTLIFNSFTQKARKELIEKCPEIESILAQGKSI